MAGLGASTARSVRTYLAGADEKLAQGLRAIHGRRTKPTVNELGATDTPRFIFDVTVINASIHSAFLVAADRETTGRRSDGRENAVVKTAGGKDAGCKAAGITAAGSKTAGSEAVGASRD